MNQRDYIARILGRYGRVGAALLGILDAVPPWAPVILWVVGIYPLAYIFGPSRLGPGLSVYVVQPALWLSLAMISYLGWRFALRDRPRTATNLVLTGFLVGAFHLALWLLAGLAFGFGESTYGHSFKVVTGNLLYVGSILLAVELSRAVVVVGMSTRPGVALLVASSLFTLVGLPMGRWQLPSDSVQLARMAGEVLLPGFAENLLASYLALLGGPLPALAYRAVPELFELLSPILPKLPWTVSALVGTLGPGLGLWAVHSSALEAGDERQGSRAAWPVVSIAAVVLLWFNVGLLGVQPTLISGKSMEPAMTTGDIAVVRETPPEEIQVGDVIRFHHEGIHVVHRVVQVETVQDDRLFVTRGDANEELDPPVTEDRVEGVVVLTIPKIGWLGIGVRYLVGQLL